MNVRNLALKASAGIAAAAASFTYACQALAAEVDSTTSAAIGTGITDSVTSLGTWLTANSSKILLGFATLGLLGLAIRYVKRIFGR